MKKGKTTSSTAFVAHLESTSTLKSMEVSTCGTYHIIAKDKGKFRDYESISDEVVKLNYESSSKMHGGTKNSPIVI